MSVERVEKCTFWPAVAGGKNYRVNLESKNNDFDSASNLNSSKIVFFPPFVYNMIFILSNKNKN